MFEQSNDAVGAQWTMKSQCNHFMCTSCYKHMLAWTNTQKCLFSPGIQTSYNLYFKRELLFDNSRCCNGPKILDERFWRLSSRLLAEGIIIALAKNAINLVNSSRYLESRCTILKWSTFSAKYMITKKHSKIRNSSLKSCKNFAGGNKKITRLE